MNWPDDRKYKGEWQDGKPHGQGTMSMAGACNDNDGRKYEGEWRDGKEHGKGTMSMADGRKYEGEWHDGKPDGWGTMTMADCLSSGKKVLSKWDEGVNVPPGGLCMRRSYGTVLLGREEHEENHTEPLPDYEQWLTDVVSDPKLSETSQWTLDRRLVRYVSDWAFTKEAERRGYKLQRDAGAAAEPLPKRKLQRHHEPPPEPKRKVEWMSSSDED